LNQPDETDLESDHVEKSRGQATEEEVTFEGNQDIASHSSSDKFLEKGNHTALGNFASDSDSDDFYKEQEEPISGSDHIAAILTQATQAEPRRSAQRRGEQVDQSQTVETQTPGKTAKKKGDAPGKQNSARMGKRLRVETIRYAPTCTPKRNTYAPDNDFSPPVVHSSILLPIQVTREKLNCAIGNTVNLLTYINHFNTGLRQRMLPLGAQTKVCQFFEIQTLIKACGYDVFAIPLITTFTELESFVTQMGIPVLINLELKFRFVTFGHVIGISPYKSSEGSQIEYHIIDGAHPEMKAMHFNKENIDWCCGNDLKLKKINEGFGFVPGRKRVLEMLNDKSGYDLVQGTTVCLTKSIKKKGKQKEELVAIERLLALNVCNKEKSQYVKIWKQVIDEHKKKKKSSSEN